MFLWQTFWYKSYFKNFQSTMVIQINVFSRIVHKIITYLFTEKICYHLLHCTACHCNTHSREHRNVTYTIIQTCIRMHRELHINRTTQNFNWLYHFLITYSNAVYINLYTYYCLLEQNLVTYLLKWGSLQRGIDYYVCKRKLRKLKR